MLKEVRLRDYVTTLRKAGSGVGDDGLWPGAVITFVEFKTGESRLSGIQRSIQDAVEGMRVRFEERRIRKENLRLLTAGKSMGLRRLVD